jgi:quercetin dioxygenase-like cupin family protein
MKSYTHDDSRRTLIEWVKNYPMRSSKIVIAKEDCIVGDHYHNHKTEIFYLLSGEGEFCLGIDGEWKSLTDVVFVPKGVRHTFRLKGGSILLSAASRQFDSKDENQI